MPNRILKEELLRDAKLDKLSDFEECLYFRMLLSVDDYGNIDARPSYLRSMLFPTKIGVEIGQVEAACEKLCAVGLVTAYEAEGELYLNCVGFAEAQNLRHPRGRYPQRNKETSTFRQPKSREEVLDLLRQT